MSEVPEFSISVNCWPGKVFPFTLDEALDHEMRENHCKEILSQMSDEERKLTDTPEGWSAFLKEHWEYDPEGYVRPPEVTKEQREEWSRRLSRRYYIVGRGGVDDKEKESDK